MQCRSKENKDVGCISEDGTMHEIWPSFKGFLLYLCVLFAPFTLWAATPSDLSGLSLEELMQIPVYGASKFEQQTREAPSDVTIVSADEIQKYGFRTLDDLLRSVRGFYLTYDRNYSYVGIRGFGIPGDYNSRILIQIDGHRINDNIYDQSVLGTGSILDLDLIERVEIIRGPGSSLYGNNAFFGVINIITKRSQDFGQPQTAASYGSYDSLKGRLSYGKEFNSRVKMAVSGSSLYAKGQDLYYPEFDTPATNYGNARQCDSDQSGNLFGRLEYGHLALESAWVSRDKTIPTASFGTDFNNPNTHTIDESWYLDLNYHHTLLNSLDITARVYYDEYRYTGQYIYQSVANMDKAVGQFWGSEVMASQPFLNGTHRLTVGAEFIDNITQYQNNEDVNPYMVYLNSNESSQKWAIYAQDEYRPTSWLLVNAGLREDHYQTFGDSVNPRIAFILLPQNSTTLKLIYGSAFRAPNAYELYYQDGFSMERPQHLDPETIRTYEAVLERRFFTHYRLKLSAFAYQIDNLIQQVTDPATQLSVFENVDSVSARGFEAEVEGVWDNGVRGNIGYTIQDVNNDTTCQTMFNSPRHNCKLNLSIPIFHSNWFLSTTDQYLSPRLTDQGSETDAVWLIDMTLLGRKIYRGVDLSISGYNLLNQKYKDPVGLEFRQNGIEQDGFGFLLKLTYTF